MAGKNVAEKKSAELSNSVVDFGADADQGFEEADQDAYSIPFVRILQSNSPQCNKADGAYVEGAESGMLLNVATGVVMNDIRVVPCHYRRVYVEWKPLDEGGGFVNEYNAEDGKELAMTLDEDYRLENGNELTDTRMHYCIDANTGDPVVIAMASSQLKKSRNWMNVMRSTKREREDGSRYNPAMFSSVFHLSTTPESNDKGSWFGWKITREGFVEDQHLYDTAKEFRAIVVAGKAEVKHEKDAVVEEEEF